MRMIFTYKYGFGGRLAAIFYINFVDFHIRLPNIKLLIQALHVKGKNNILPFYQKDDI